MKNSLKTVLIIFVAIGAFITLGFLSIQSCQNKAVSLEEAIETAQSDMKIQEKKRVDLIYNLADCVKEYDKHEAETIQAIAEGRSQGEAIDNASMAIKAVSEAYPELKSSENYKELMRELTTLENEISQYRQAYNKSVERYNRYTRKFIQKAFLEWTGYEKKEYKRLDYNASVDAPQDIFGE